VNEIFRDHEIIVKLTMIEKGIVI